MSRDDEFVSVVMPVHNALPHLEAAVRSILDQTHRNFEFIIYDDASTDGSTAQLREFAKMDGRIRLIESSRNRGPVGSSNLVVENSRADIVARMDADDLCAPDRLARQLELLNTSPRAGLIGTLFEVIDDDGRRIRGPDYWRLRRKSPFVPFAHGAFMFRRSAFERVGGYREGCEYWEDQDLVVRMSEICEIWVIPEALYQVRQWSKNTRISSERTRVEDAVDLMYQSITRLEAGRGYDDLIRDHARAGDPLDPRVFIAAGSLILWAGGRPQLFGRLLKKGRLRPDFGTVSALVWTAWAELSPSSLRGFLRVLLTAKNWRAADVAHRLEPLRWSPNGAEGEIVPLEPGIADLPFPSASRGG